MSRLTLNASVRTSTGKGAARKIRAQGLVPAVVYGAGTEATSLTVNAKEVVAILDSAAGRHQPIDLSVDGTAHLALIRDYEVHPYKRTLRHIDFWSVKADQEISVKVPLRRAGVSPIEKIGGRVRFTTKQIKIRCAAGILPPAIEFDLSGITEDSIQRPPRVSEVPLPDGVSAIFKNDYAFLQIRLKGADVAEEEEEEAAVEEATE